MNALLAVIKQNKAIFVANDARLLKKCSLGFLILALTSIELLFDNIINLIKN